MLAPLLLLAGHAFQGLSAPELGPMVSPGSAALFHQLVIGIEEDLQAGQFSRAATKARLLPGTAITIRWDATNAPSDLRESYEEARDAAIKQWRQNIPQLDLKLVQARADIKISFEPLLAKAPGETYPAGAALFFSDSKSEPRLEAVIGLKRGVERRATTEREVGNSVLYAIGAYLGVERTTSYGGALAYIDVPTSVPARVMAHEVFVANTNLHVASELEAAIKAHRRLTPARPGLFLEPEQIDLPETLQGERAPFSLQVNNRGNSPLSLQVAGDCSCVHVSGGGVIASHESTLIRGEVDTSELSGQFHRRVILTSNDPNHPVLGASVRVNVRPAYRILSSQPKVVIIGDQGADLEAYLVIEPGIKITPLSVRLDGLKGKVTYEPWSGNLADPDRKEPARPREGYLFRIHVDPTDFGVSAQIGIAVATDNPKFPVLRRGFGIQRGIAVSPDELYLGEVGAKARPFSFLVSRPGHPFRLLSASSDTPYLKVGKLPTDSKDEFKLSVSYLGHALPGPIRASILLTTDEPTQRTVVLRVSGEAR